MAALETGTGFGGTGGIDIDAEFAAQFLRRGDHRFFLGLRLLEQRRLRPGKAAALTRFWETVD